MIGTHFCPLKRMSDKKFLLLFVYVECVLALKCIQMFPENGGLIGVVIGKVMDIWTQIQSRVPFLALIVVVVL